jgi:hypothetical protein
MIVTRAGLRLRWVRDPVSCSSGLLWLWSVGLAYGDCCAGHSGLGQSVSIGYFGAHGLLPFGVASCSPPFSACY